MTAPRDGDGYNREVTILQERVSNLHARQETIMRQLEGIDRRVSDFAVITVQMQELRERHTELRLLVGELRKETEDRQRYMDQFKAQLEGLSENRSGRVSSAYLTVVGFGVAIITSLAVLVANMLSKGVH